MPVSASPPLDNVALAERLEELAGLLESHAANPFRVRAYRRAAETLRKLPRPARDVLDEEGVEGLVRLPAIGKSIARSLDRLIHSGRLGLLDRMRGEVDPERIFATLPGVGPVLAHQIHEELGVETLHELEAAGHDGRLAELPGVGPTRLQGILDSLTVRLHHDKDRRRRPRPRAPSGPRPSIADLLEVDAEYRAAVAADRLPRIAPRRFNPTGAEWLPVLHTEREERHYTALYSNTARAHELGRTHDWVVVYRDDAEGDGTSTVLTASFGPLRGKRVVAGREAECRAYYDERERSTTRE